MPVAAAVLERHDQILRSDLRGSKVIQTLMRDQCLELSVDPVWMKDQCVAAIDGMRLVTSNPEIQALFPWHTHLDDAYGRKYEQEAGLKHETEDGENKYVFQFIHGARYAIGEMGRYTSTSFHASHISPFLSALSSIEKMARSIGLEIARRMDESLGTTRPYSGNLFDRILRGTVVLRVLQYKEVAASSLDAIPHIDRSVLTIHIYASHEGLVIVLPNGEKIRIKECSFDWVCAFFGRKFMAMTHNTSNGRPHGVKYVRKNDEDRFCIVAFIHPIAIDSDAAWLLAHDAQVKAYERKILL